MKQYWEKQPEFFMGEHAIACHRHQGDIGERWWFAEQQIKMAKEPDKDFLPLLGLYTRSFKWWSGNYTPRVCLLFDNIREYADNAGINEDIVFP